MNLKFNNTNNTGLTLVLAWPETYCKQAGGWYDSFLNFLGISRHRYYKVGHAAIVLIDYQGNECHYFDFGRYHTPFAHGRVRSKETDHELEIKTKAFFDDKNELLNLDEIITEISEKEECHGSGALHIGINNVNFHKAKNKALEMQLNSPLIYGPFEVNGSNCSRFVRTIMKSGSLSFIRKIKMYFPLSISPTPIGNIQISQSRTKKSPSEDLNKYTPKKQEKNFYKSTLNTPKRPVNVSYDAKWLTGEGAGSWFQIEKLEELLRIRKYSPSGILESDGVFDKVLNFDIDDAFKMDYPSHSILVTINQNSTKIQFLFLERYGKFLLKVREEVRDGFQLENATTFLTKTKKGIHF